jgi:hypothetical protein
MNEKNLFVPVRDSTTFISFKELYPGVMRNYVREAKTSLAFPVQKNKTI